MADAKLDEKALAGALIAKIDRNPALRIPVLTMLEACADERREMGELYEQVAEELEDKGALPVQPMSAIADMLVRTQGAQKTIEVEGEPYAGTDADLAADQDITEDMQVLEYLSITPVGGMVLSSCAPLQRVINLFEDMPQFREAMVRTLELCDVPGGLTAAELQESLGADGFLYRDSRDLPTVYPSMYANYLKDAEALRWSHAWITTDVGCEVLAACRLNAAS